MNSDKFDWINDTNIVIHEQPAIAVHKNDAGQILIRQRDFYEENDAVIYLNPESAEVLAEAITRAAAALTTNDTGATLHVIAGGRKKKG